MACVFMKILANGLEAGAILHQFVGCTVPIWDKWERRKERGVMTLEAEEDERAIEN
jgi:hypothetical protein